MVAPDCDETRLTMASSACGLHPDARGDGGELLRVDSSGEEDDHEEEGETHTHNAEDVLHVIRLRTGLERRCTIVEQCAGLCLALSCSARQ